MDPQERELVVILADISGYTAGRPQISRADVILAHRLLKNSLPNREYLLMTEAAWRELGREMHAEFEEGSESCEGFGAVRTFVQRLDGAIERGRESFYALSPGDFAARARRYASRGFLRDYRALLDQPRHPAVTASWPKRIAFAFVQPGRVRARRAAGTLTTPAAATAPPRCRALRASARPG